MQTMLRTLALTGGDWVIYGLLLCSIIAVAVIIERGLLLKKETDDFAALRAAMLAGLDADLQSLEKIAGKHHGAAARILKSALKHSHESAEGVEDLLVATSLEERGKLEKRLLVLGTLGSNAP